MTAGDFRSAECVEFLQEADVVVTNPPFSLFREYFGLLTQCRKAFCIMGSLTAVRYRAIWPYIKSGAVRFEYGRKFVFEGGAKASPVRWYTTFPVKAPPLVLTKRYAPELYPHYDNYRPAIEVSRVSNIPMDFDEPMGVPITLLDFDVSDYEILGLTCGFDTPDFFINLRIPNFKLYHPCIADKALFTRIFIRRRRDV